MSIIQEVTKYVVEGVEYSTKQEALGAIAIKDMSTTIDSFLGDWEFGEIQKEELEVYLEDFVKHLIKKNYTIVKGE